MCAISPWRGESVQAEMRVARGEEMGFICYGEHGLHAIEVTSSSRICPEDLASLRLFRREYPMAKAWLFDTVNHRLHDSVIEVVPLTDALPNLATLLGPQKKESR